MQYQENNKEDLNISAYSRLVQMVKVYMLNPVGSLSPCPLSMTDGAAFLFEYINKNNPELYSWGMKDAYRRILSNDPSEFYTSGQWMTELLGGSDVRASTETKALPVEGETNTYKLYGLKWFTSAIDADITFTLAKITDPITKKVDDLPTLFFLYVKNRKETGKLNNISVIRLKDKLGTRQLPTAELQLKGSIAEIASPRGKGIAYIMQLANITRMHNIVSSVGFMRGMLSLIEDYSKTRRVFGKQLVDQELHYNMYKNLQSMFDGNLLLSLYVSKLMGDSYALFNSINNSKLEDKNLTNKYEELEIKLRLLLSLGKIYCSRQSELFCLEGIQCFGALGYMENSGIPLLLRDTMVTAIWEGTFNTLSLEFFKVFLKGSNSKLFFDLIFSLLESSKYKSTNLEEIIKKLLKIDLKSIIYNKREFCFLLSSLLVTALVINFNKQSNNEFLISYWEATLEKEYNNFTHSLVRYISIIIFYLTFI